MKKITKEQFYEDGKGKTAEVVNALNSLAVGEALHILPEDWKVKTGPTSMVRQIFRAKRSDKRFATKTVSNGWYVLRTN